MPQITDLLSPELRAEVNRQVQADQAKAAHAERENARTSGVHFSGPVPIRFTPRTADQIVEDASKAVAKMQAFRASPRGRFLRALRGLREISYGAEADAAHAAYSRGMADDRLPVDPREAGFAIKALVGVPSSDAREAIAAVCELLTAQGLEAA